MNQCVELSPEKVAVAYLIGGVESQRRLEAKGRLKPAQYADDFQVTLVELCSIVGQIVGHEVNFSYSAISRILIAVGEIQGYRAFLMTSRYISAWYRVFNPSSAPRRSGREKLNLGSVGMKLHLRQEVIKTLVRDQQLPGAYVTESRNPPLGRRYHFTNDGIAAFLLLP